ncbi:MAG: valine--tRNA ligase [Candidatus Nealsonbacteria bacterium]|nr:valine--tRNA ligase [Candidatus Nealsonbacteria bacterium]
MELPKIYDHHQVEDKISAFWEKGGFFKPKIVKGKKPFTITLPPPNVTGSLHTGHAMYVVEDIMARQKRMEGFPTLWLPGFDHASIAVEYLVSKQLKKEGVDKKTLGREKFLERAREFAATSRRQIKNQLQKLGFSLDWSREAYTMDKARSTAVKEAFDRLSKKGLIYQGEYIVNWCPGCQTAISDLENEYKDEIGQLYYIKYGPIIIATTRPETMFADVAVAIHPDNQKYKHLVGQLVPLPLTNRKIPVIEDKAVDPDFGTGALKITPAHDQLDFEIGARHHLEKPSALGFNGRLSEICGPEYQDLSVKEGRAKAVENLQAQNLIEKIEDLNHSVGHCQRCGAVTEPLISKQWFVKTKTMAERAIKAVKDGEIQIVPKRFEKVYFHWLKNIKDWCISRQLWWGHKIPLDGVEDTLDTWFSSGLWPISTLGWPQNTPDFKYFYPTTVRETGYDILFFWVAREIMMCLEMTGKVPFRIVYLHGLVRDEKGRKFSKTAGIGFDPLEMTAKYGTDALRMALIYGNAEGADLKIGEEKIGGMRNFTNKIWNATRFILLGFDGKANKSRPNKDDRWILKELEKTVRKTNGLMNEYRYGQAAEVIYQFFWKEFCDKYIELTKERRGPAQPILLEVLTTSLKLLHPFMPFVTEEIYQKLPLKKKKKSLSIETWPKP